MYTIEEINSSLENDKLSDALYKLERFSESQGLSELAKWCSHELNGWEGVDFLEEEKEKIIKYRYVSVDWVNHFGQKVNWKNPQHYILNPPIWFGVEDIEGYLAEGLTLINNKVNETSRNIYNSELKANVSIEQIQSLFERIRKQARRRFHNSYPRVPNRKLLYPSPNFAVLVSDTDLVRVLSNRWSEANLAFESRAYLATVILLGSILEGVLLDKVEQNSSQSLTSTKCPKDKKTGKILSFDKWKLIDLIEVSHDCGWLKKEAKDFSHVVRDYRNFIHPNKERKEGIKFEEPICKLVWEVVGVALS